MLREPSPTQQTPLMQARQNAEKSKDLSALRLLYPLFANYKKLLFGGLACVALAGAVVLGLGQVFRYVIDQGMQQQDPAQLRHGLFLLIGLVVLLAISSYGRLVLLTGMAEQLMADLRAKVLEHLLYLDLTWHEKQKTGDLLSRLLADTSLLQVMVGTSLPVAVRNVFLTIGGLVLMIHSSIFLALVVVALIPFIVAILYMVGPSVRQTGRALQDNIGVVGGRLSESLTAMREIQAFTRQSSQVEDFSLTNNAAILSAWAYVRRRGLLSSLVIFVVFSAIAALLWVGGQQVIHGTLTAGQLSAFIFYALLLAGSVGTLSEIYGDLQRAAGALERINNLLQTTSHLHVPAQPMKLPLHPKKIEFQDIIFAYPSRPDIQTLQRINLSIGLDQTVAFVGSSGAGKTTCFDLLLRFYDPAQGAVCLDGINIQQFDVQEYRRLFALVPQTPTLFSQSIVDNIRFGMNASLQEVMSAARDAGAHDFIMALPEGYETLLGERGARLSGGQAQRLALARALLSDPTILLLDEATAHLDSTTEQAVQQTLAVRRAGRCTIIIAHRLSTIQHADIIIVLDAGKIIASGSHAQLMETCMLYQQLVTAQRGL